MSYDPNVIGMIVQAAGKTGADPVTALASGLVESSLNPGAVGDQGTSFGTFQWHRGGALGTHDPGWTRTLDAYLERMQAFAHAAGATPGQRAANAQRPADPSGYAARVNAELPTARSLLAAYRGGTTMPTLDPSSSLAGASSATADDTQQRRANLAQYLINSNAKAAGISAIRLPGANIPGGNLGDDLTRTVQLPGTMTPARIDTNPTKLPGAPTVSNAIAKAAENMLGIPYSWGGGNVSGPTKGIAQGANTVGFDCSSLVQNILHQFGVNVPRVTYDQFRTGTPVDRKSLSPGDLLFFHPGANGPGHVGIYIGNNQFVHAPHTGSVVQVADLSSRTDYVGARRYIGAKR